MKIYSQKVQEQESYANVGDYPTEDENMNDAEDHEQQRQALQQPMQQNSFFQARNWDCVF